MIVLAEWLNANEVRRYPLHDDSSGEVPNNVIVDARLWIPKGVGRVVFISSIGITPSLVTLTLLAAENSPFLAGTGTPGNFTPLAVVRASKPVTKFVNVAVEALYPGIGGWVAFGEGAVSISNLNLRFSTPNETQLNERCVTAYDDAAVTSLGKVNVTGLRGLIQLSGEAGILKTFKAFRTIEGVLREVVVIGMDLAENKLSKLRNYAGVCGGRPQVGTCSKRVVERINTVEPDNNGNIELIFEGDSTVGDVQQGLIVDFPVGLDDICPESIHDHVPFPPPDGPPSPVPPEPPPEPSGSSAQSSSAPVLPYYCEDFEDGQAEELENVGSDSAFEVMDVEDRGKRYVSAAGCLTEQLSIDVHRIFDMSMGDVYTVTGIIRPREVNGNGFLVAGFLNTNSFTFAGLSLADGGKFFIGIKVNQTGGNWPNGLGQGYRFYLDFEPNWDTPADTDYRVTFAIYNSNIAEMKVAWNDGTADREQTQMVALLSFNVRGRAGLGVVGAETEFDEYGINCDEYPSSSSSSES
jgi:hypothetical protein